MSGNFVVNAKSVKELATILNDTGLSEIEYQYGEHRIRVVKTIAPVSYVATAPTPAPLAAAPAIDIVMDMPLPKLSAGHPGAVTSPMVGTAYLAAEPGAPNFVKAGDDVSQGQTLLVIEAMKVMNPIRASKAGRVAQVFVKDASPVEFGELLIVIE